jgi:hypothetical protein
LTTFVSGAAVSRPSWIAPLYGYAVCLIAVVTLLIAVTNFVEAAFHRANPLQARGGFAPRGASLSSFEAFRATYGEERPTRAPPAPGAAAADTLSTAELRARYDALRADHLARVSFQATQDLVKHGLLIAIAIALFVSHWRWLRRRDDDVPR